MSPIGRVFIVLNLGLAFAFVGFAGTYLKHATNWKASHDDVVAKADAGEKQRLGEIAALQADINEARRNLTSTDSLQKSTQARLDEATRENERLANQLTSLEGTLKAAQSNLATMGDKVDAATGRADDAYKLALKASEERNGALSDKVAAEASLTSANSKIADLEMKVADQNTKVASLKETIGEKDVILAYVKDKLGGALPGAVPAMSGAVVVVGGANSNLVTVRLDSKAGEAKPGHSLAIHGDGTYKGEFVVDEVDGDNLFGRMTVKVQGASVRAGDKADSQPGR